jgi:hypothetical protein
VHEGAEQVVPFPIPWPPPFAPPAGLRVRARREKAKISALHRWDPVKSWFAGSMQEAKRARVERCGVAQLPRVADRFGGDWLERACCFLGVEA